MATEITTSENALGGIKTEKLPEMTKEQKAEQKKNDEVVLRSYALGIAQREIEVEKLEKALELDLPNREVRDMIDKHKAEIAKSKKFKEIVEGRNK